MIFLDGPVGTGFSYSKTALSGNTSDYLFADHIHDFVQEVWIFILNFSITRVKLCTGTELFTAQVILQYK